jgi:predicted dehydrogenase/threonine dehydrogenase-like Zn-dependent dehydrogenase
LKQPENVKKVVEMVRDQGLKRTLDRVSGKLAAGSATGYSAAGIVVEVGAEVTGFQVGDRVACAGAGIANHADYVDVPVNLTVKLPDNVSTEAGCTVTLGAIAMQGVRRAAPTLGETFVVVGLGVLGQMTAQMLAANGCRVIGVDIDAERIAVAQANGMDAGINSAAENYIEQVVMMTDGFGADGTIVTAASADHRIISEAMQACRKKGRVVLVGDVGLNLNRGDFYRKEIDFLISCSYGPGRYDATYEEGGQDYPLPYVRWTENRNMQAYLHLLSKGQLRLDRLTGPAFPIDEATNAYKALSGESGKKPLIALLAYDTLENAGPPKRRIDIQPRSPSEGKIRVAIAGASSFAQGVHLPNLSILRDDFALRAVMSRTGANARTAGMQGGADYCTTDYDEILTDKDVDLVLIATRHDLHGAMTLKALAAGKHVFVEKPLTLAPADLDEIEAFYRENPAGPVLMTGFNRRFSPAFRAIQTALGSTPAPLIATYRMNAGHVPADSWLHGEEGGGRNLGEACHIYDLFNALSAGAPVAAVQAASITPNSGHWQRNDNFVATVTYANGSVCTLTYTAMGAKAYPKERMEIFSRGQVIALDNYKSVEIHGGRGKGWQSRTIDKGQLDELKALAGTLRRKAPWPISLDDQLSATRTAFEVERQIIGA